MKSIIFNTEEIQAILDGRKSQFRKPILFDILDEENHYSCNNKSFRQLSSDKSFACPNCGGMQHKPYQPKYKTDDILYVKETFGEYYQMCNHGNFCDCKPYIVYKAGQNFLYDIDCINKWKSAVHLKEEDSRMFLKVTNIRVKRLQDMKLVDLANEGKQGCTLNAFDEYKKQWNKKAKDGYKWEDNPYVFVYEFERVER